MKPSCHRRGFELRLATARRNYGRHSDWLNLRNSMPKGPSGQKRPADTIGCAVMVARIATGEITEDLMPLSGRVRSGRARADKLSPKQRTEIAKKAASKRWG